MKRKLNKAAAVGILSAAVLIGGAIGAGTVGLTSAQENRSEAAKAAIAQAPKAALNTAAQSLPASPAASESTQSKRIGKEKAKQLALNVVQGRVESVELERYNGQLYYEVEIDTGKRDVDVWIDAYSGKSLGVKDDDDDDDDDRAAAANSGTHKASAAGSPAASAPPAAAKPSSSGKAIAAAADIGAEKAAQIALKHVGGKVVEVEKERDDGVRLYEVKLAVEGRTVEVDVHAANGSILKIDRDDDDDDDDWDDDWDDDDDDDDWDDDDDDDWDDDDHDD